ncbi:MAG: flap endonuclease-1 [Candidatus Micrarchaeia archaeon]
MAVDLSKIAVKRKILLDELNSRTVAIDAYNMLYQFLSIIRQPDGTPLVDSKGNVTSHLSGLFYRSIDLISKGISLVYVFDGIPSLLKQRAIEARVRKRAEAYASWQEAVKEGNIEEARVHAQASTRIDKSIVESAKTLLGFMGIPYVNAPSEGEAEAVHICKQGLAYAVVSQDYDVLLLGADKTVRNIAISGKRKLPRKNVYISVEPEMVDLNETLKSNGVTQEQLIWIGIMLGTDFNEGIKGIGPKTALKIAKKANSLEEVEKIIKEEYKQEFDVDIKEVRDLFANPEVKDVDPSSIKQSHSINKEAIIKFMCEDHEFSEERISKYIEMLKSKVNGAHQKTIGSWL